MLQVICDRQALHAIPELELELPKTAAYIRRALEGLNCRVFSPMEHGVCAFFDFGADDAIAFRADMDALPFITELPITPHLTRKRRLTRLLHRQKPNCILTKNQTVKRYMPFMILSQRM